ncbi:hypothetical protein [Pedobacter heparinus]|uniref:hypothetical protein n=1 Tax=Pedobacter heparinus TaxID=984 RepID=UPI00293122B0|nr:hypothetical protein [Pedobacter heparinus]
MKIKCIAIKLEKDQLILLGKYGNAKNHFSVSIGKEYIVFGLTFRFEEFGSGCFVEILSDNNHLIQVPILLFNMIDPRPSKHWEIKQFSEKLITFWPPSMYKDFYHDDLSEDVPDVVEDFLEVKKKILFEF